MEVNGKFVLIIRIDFIPTPYYLSNKGEENGVYIRLGNSNRLATKETIAEIKRAHHHPFFDKSPYDNVTEDDLEKQLIQSIFSKRNSEIDTVKLLSLGILTKKGKRIVASNGGVILFGKPEIRQIHFPYAEVRCARFADTTRAEFIDRLNIEESILGAIDEVPKFIRRNTKMAGKFGAMKRRDIPEYPIDGIREALTNALVHANYEIPGTRIFVAIYDDKLEIQNPGIMPPGMSIEQLKAGVSRIRNPMIARVFGELGLVEEWGSGYKRIKYTCQRHGYPEPQWEELGNVLRVTFFPHPEVAKITTAGTKLGLSRDQVEANIELTPEILVILNKCQQPCTIIEIMKALQWKSRTKFRQKFIASLLDSGLLRMTIPEKPKSSRQKYQSTELGLKMISDVAIK